MQLRKDARERVGDLILRPGSKYAKSGFDVLRCHETNRNGTVTSFPPDRIQDGGRLRMVADSGSTLLLNYDQRRVRQSQKFGNLLPGGDVHSIYTHIELPRGKVVSLMDAFRKSIGLDPHDLRRSQRSA